jgi:Flp pilus assembly protein TadD
MSPRLVFAAAAAVVALATGAAPALARADADQGAPQTKPAKSAPAKMTPKKASPLERAAADRLEPLARAAFWAHETDADPTDAEAGVKLSKALRLLKRNDEALAAVGRVLVFHPKDLEGLLELARDQIQNGHPFEALEPLRQAEAVAPRDWRAPSLRGVAYDQLGRPDDARQAWQAALRLSPDNPAVLSNLAMSLAAAGEAGKAETLLRKAVQSPEATIITRQDLALVLGLQGKTAEAEKLIRDDVPPVEAAADLAWFKAPAAPAPKPETRTWSSLEAQAGK